MIVFQTCLKSNFKPVFIPAERCDGNVLILHLLHFVFIGIPNDHDHPNEGYAKYDHPETCSREERQFCHFLSNDDAKGIHWAESATYDGWNGNSFVFTL